MQRLELRIPPPAVMAAAVAIMWPVSKAAPSLDYVVPIQAGIGLIAAGLAIGVVAFLQFRKAKTTINPMTPHESTALVTNGLYGFSRNPIYVADVIILVGCALRGRFGGAFDDYCRKVRRWL